MRYLKISYAKYMLNIKYGYVFSIIKLKYELALKSYWLVGAELEPKQSYFW